MLSDVMDQKIENLPAILSINEVASFFKVVRMTIIRLIQTNKLAAYKDDEGRWCILRGDLAMYCSKNSNF
jgi:excisionase family DNA binding protein